MIHHYETVSGDPIQFIDRGPIYPRSLDQLILGCGTDGAEFISSGVVNLGKLMQHLANCPQCSAIEQPPPPGFRINAHRKGI